MTPDPATAEQGAGDQVFTFRVPNESQDANTVAVTLQLPQDHPIAAVDVLAVRPWTSTTTTRTLAKPIKTDDGSFSEVADTITWKGGSIPPGGYGEFKILAQGLPDDATSLDFKATQTYDDGSAVAWIETDAAAEHPAPVVKLVAPSKESDSGSVATTSPSSSGSSSDSKGLAIAGVILGALALLVAVAAYIRRSSAPAGDRTEE